MYFEVPPDNGDDNTVQRQCSSRDSATTAMRPKLNQESFLVRADHRQSRYVKVRPSTSLESWRGSYQWSLPVAAHHRHQSTISRTSRTINLLLAYAGQVPFFWFQIISPLASAFASPFLLSFVKEPILQPKFIRLHPCKRMD
jgi:hypothetical protein